MPPYAVTPKTEHAIYAADALLFYRNLVSASGGARIQAQRRVHPGRATFHGPQDPTLRTTLGQRVRDHI
jgi:hypothetical protein